MRIFRAIGLGLVIIFLQFLVPSIWSGLEHTTLQFFQTLDSLMASSQLAIESGSLIPNADKLIPH